jgi:hypothetical protein
MLDSSHAASPLDALSDYLDRWGAAHLSTQPADRETAEDGVRLAYAAAGLVPPRRIVWCGGPLEIAKHLATTSLTDAVGVNVKAQIFDQVQARVGTFAESVASMKRASGQTLMRRIPPRGP